MSMLIGKLGCVLVKEATSAGMSLLCQEASALAGLFREIHDVKEELESMQTFLQGTEQFKDTNNATGIFIKKIRSLAFEIEDIVDEFTYKLEDNHGGFTAKMGKRIRNLKSWHRLTHKLQKIKQNLEDAHRRNARYSPRGMDNSAEGSGSHANSDHQYVSSTREDGLVGIKEHSQLLVRWLTNDFEQGSKIVSVWGMGGVGKTTLVSHVYNAIKIEFDVSAWVTVSNRYQAVDLLKNIATDLGISVEIVNTGMRNLVDLIYNYLQGKKYILVLDDVWGVDVWFNIMGAFPENSISRFVITSRIQEVASLATGNCVLELKPLQPNHSWVLFCKEAFWKNENKTCPAELHSLAQKFVEKCNGLPIAIACPGRLLSGKQTYTGWENIYRELEYQLTNNVILDVNIILRVSLEDLPHDLKNCFLHCAIFPEDYMIKRRRVMRHWITAGFIKVKEHKTLEEVAEGYLNELVNRSLLQVVKRNVVGRVKCCRIHDIVRLLVLTKANEECFCQIYDVSRAFSVEDTRRISIQSVNIEQFIPSGTTRLRALYVFESNIKIIMLRPILKSSIFLSTLDLQGAQFKMLPPEVFNLFNLRYLGLRHTHIEVLPEAIGRLRNLEVLDAVNTKLVYLPNNVVKLQKLRYLYACTFGDGKSVQPFGGVKLPIGIRYLTGLRALQCAKATSEALTEFGALTELRTFGVTDVKNKHSVSLCDAITKMIHLIHLEITALDEMEVMHLERLHLPVTLSSLGIEGQIEKSSLPVVFSCWSQLNNITRLKLAFSKLDENSFCSLLTLGGLYHLSLLKAYNGERLHFSARSFPKLRYLGIWDAPNLNKVEVEEGAMQNLVELKFISCPEFKVLPHGIEHLTALQKLCLEETSEVLVEKLLKKREPNEKNEDLEKISHIKNVTVRLIQKGIFERISR